MTITMHFSTNHLALLCIVFYSPTRKDENLFTFHFNKSLLHLQVHFHWNQFGYGINYKYEGMWAHSFYRVYVVTKFILPSIKDLKFSKLNYDNTCAYLDVKNGHNAEAKKYTLELLAFCKKIEPYVDYSRKQIRFNNNTAHYILKFNFPATTYKTKVWYYHHIGLKLHRVSLWRNFQFSA